MWKKNGYYYNHHEVIVAMEIVDFIGDEEFFANQFGLQYEDMSEQLIKELILEGYEAKAAWVYFKLYGTTLKEAYDEIQRRSSSK